MHADAHKTISLTQHTSNLMEKFARLSMSKSLIPDSVKKYTIQILHMDAFSSVHLEEQMPKDEIKQP